MGTQRDGTLYMNESQQLPYLTVVPKIWLICLVLIFERI